MEKISVLDCTLRDGGYCNLWRFGKNNIKFIISKLVDAGVDVIECGFLTNREECLKLSEKEYQKQLSLAIVCGIIEYKEAISTY